MRIAFIKVGPNDLFHNAVLTILQKEFPDCEITTFDITHDIFGGPLRAALGNAAWSIREYGLKAFRNRQKLMNNFYTSGYFKAVRRLMRSKIKPAEFLFSFQSQSLFDASVPGLPHFVYTDHTHLANLTYPDYNSRNLAAVQWINLERSIYHRASMVFTMSSNITDSLIRQYNLPPERICCIGAGPHVIPAQDPDCSTKRYAAHNILFNGRDWERKGGPELFAAFCLLQRTIPDLQLTIAGCRPPMGDRPGLRIIGPVDDDYQRLLTEEYSRASLFCLPSHVEPMGLAILEAMHFALPVVATDIGAIPDMIKHKSNGLLTPPGDVVALASALQQILLDPALGQRFGLAGRQRARENYTWEIAGNNIGTAIRNWLSTIS